MADDIKPKLQQIIEMGFEDTGRKFIFKGENLPVYGIPGEKTGIVYNPKTDKIVRVYAFQFPYKGKEADKNGEL